MQGPPDALQRGVRLGIRLHRHRLFHLFQLGPAVRALCQVLFHQSRAGRAGHLFSIQGQQVPDHITFHFHLHVLLCWLCGAFHPNNAAGDKTLQLFQFSFQNKPPEVWNSSQGFTLLLPSLKSMVISSPKAPRAWPFSTVWPLLTDTAWRP